MLGTLLLLIFCSNTSFVKAQEMGDYPDMRVLRVVQIENGGALVVYDNVTLSAGIGQHVGSLDEFQIGFPVQYRSNLAHFLAYDASGRLPAALDGSVGGAGFSWVTVAFRELVDVSEGSSYDFSVVWVFSGLLSANQSLFRAEFPVYPSLGEEASFCNVTVRLPVEGRLESFSSDLLNRTVGARQVLYSEQVPLGAYSNVSSWAEFTAYIYGFRLLDVEEWRREIKIDGLAGLAVTDLYQITNREGTSIDKISIALPPNATDISVQDIYGSYAQNKLDVDYYEEHAELGVTLREALRSGEQIKLLIVYGLPFGGHVTQNGWQDYVVNVSYVRPYDWVIKRSTVTVSLPEGAEFGFSSQDPSRVEKEGFLVKVEFAKDNVTRFYEPSISVEYRYLILWASFRPTLWVGVVVAIFGGMFFLRRFSRPEAVVTVVLSPEVVGKFVDLYEDKRRLRSTLETLERQLRRGKISRRRYRLRRSSLDGRMSRLQKDLAGLKVEIEGASSRYAEWMRQLETAEAEIETLDRDIGRVEVRYRRREISAEARRRLLDEYSGIRDRSENRIAGILLRLREEIR